MIIGNILRLGSSEVESVPCAIITHLPDSNREAVRLK